MVEGPLGGPAGGGPRGGPAGGGPVHSPGSPVEELCSPNYHSWASIDPKIDRKHRAFSLDFVWVCGLKHPGNPELRFKPRFSRFLNDVTLLLLSFFVPPSGHFPTPGISPVGELK